MTLRMLIAVCVLFCAVPPAAGGEPGAVLASVGQIAADESMTGEIAQDAEEETEATEPVNIKIEGMEFCTGIESWSPVGAGRMFPNTVEKIYCFTRVTGAAEPTEIVHVWYLNDEEKARVTLGVRSKNWRTWSSKRMLDQWTGKWRVDVQTADGKLLRSSEFLLESETQTEQE